jgi:predicted dehydrogenase
LWSVGTRAELDPQRPAGIGIIGCGHVSTQYFEGLRRFERILDIRACADRVEERAAAAGAGHGVRACRVDELLRSSEVEIVVNLTPPRMHAEVTAQALAAGKHCYSEKPLAANLDEARRLLDDARRASVTVGCAPDTVLGTALQTCRRLIDDGAIGRPVAAVAFVSEHGYEHFHPNVDAFYRPGGGPLLDLGPYYVTALVHFFGPVARATAFARASFRERTIVAPGPRCGERIPVRVPTHATGALEFESGLIATVLMSWDLWATHLPYIEVYGTAGSLAVPNPDEFSGAPALRRAGPEERRQPPPAPGELPWVEMPLTQAGGTARGVGVAEMVCAIRSGRRPRASGELAYHVLETLIGLESSAKTGRHVEIESRCARPDPLTGAGFALARPGSAARVAPAGSRR